MFGPHCRMVPATPRSKACALSATRGVVAPSHRGEAKVMAGEKKKLSIEVSEEALECIEFLARGEGISVEEMSKRLLADEAEAQAGLTRGPFKRKYMHR